MTYKFSQPLGDEGRKTLVDGLSTLTKMSLNKQVEGNSGLTIKYSVTDVDYNELNDRIKAKVLKYSAEQAMIPEAINVLTPSGLAQAFSNTNFEWNFFSIQTQVLGMLLADTEVGEILRFVNMSVVGLGDSMTYEVGGRSLYDVEETTYGNNVTRPRKQFAQPLTIKPSPKEASVQFDVIQMLTSNYDFGAEMAKIVLSIRAAQYQAAVDLLFDETPITGTPFYSATFNKANYTGLADLLQAVNGTAVTAFASRRAWADASENVVTGFSVQDELVKKSYIADLYNVSSQILTQAVDTSTASFAFRVPNDKIVIMPNLGDKPVKIVGEDYVRVKLNDGDNNSIQNRVYKYIYSYGIGLVTSTAYGIQEV